MEKKTYLVEDIPHAQRKKRRYKPVNATDKIKRCCVLAKDDPEDVENQKNRSIFDYREDAENLSRTPRYVGKMSNVTIYKIFV